MSHFTVMVIGEDPEGQLAPFDENIEMEPFVKFTKEELIEETRKEIQEYKKAYYDEYMADPEKYAAECRNPRHVEYIANEFPAKLNFTDEELYQEGIKYEEPKNLGPNGEVYSTYNPKSKWDWYSLGGRWSGLIKLKEGAEGIEGESGVFGNETGIDAAMKKDIDNLDEIRTFAVVKDGEWYERGSMGWWGMVSDEKDEAEWESQFKKLLDGLPDDTMISIYDCHI